MYSNLKIDSFDDFQGKKIRAAGALRVAAVQAMGATPVAMPGPEVAIGLTRGTIDAAFTSIDYGMEQGLWDLLQYVSVWPVDPQFVKSLCASAEAYDALPDDLKQALDRAVVRIREQAFYADEVQEGAYLTAAMTLPATLVLPIEQELAKAQEATMAITDMWLEDTGPQGQLLLDLTEKYM